MITPWNVLVANWRSTEKKFRPLSSRVQQVYRWTFLLCLERERGEGGGFFIVGETKDCRDSVYTIESDGEKLGYCI